MSSLGLAREMGISNWQLAGQLSDGALEAYLAGVCDYRPARPGPIGAGRAGAAAPRLEPAAFEAELRRALPLADALAWLLSAYPERSAGEILRLYGLVISRRYGIPRPGPEPRSYVHGPVTFRAYHLCVPGPAQAAP